jgi:hypothetical protein
MEKFKSIWDEYKEFLMEKYPAKEGEEWKFTCPHHQKIDDLLNNETQSPLTQKVIDLEDVLSSVELNLMAANLVKEPDSYVKRSLQLIREYKKID